MKQEVIKAIEKEKIIVIVRGLKREKLIPLCNALYDGGIKIIEVTFDSTGRVPDNETANAINALTKEFEGKMYIGAGTVLTDKQVFLTKKAGGKFIISPNTDKKVIKSTVKSGLVSIPGALSPTEIQSAYSAGADFIKIFPAVNFGTDYIRAVKAPLSHVRLLAFGGIKEDDVKDFVDAGISGFGVGSKIIDENAIEEGNFEKITELAKKYVHAING